MNSSRETVLDMPIPITITTVEDMQGNLPAVRSQNMNIVPANNGFTQIMPEVNMNQATNGKSIPEALAYHLACIQLLSGTAQNPTDNQNNDTQPRSGFRRMVQSFD